MTIRSANIGPWAAGATAMSIDRESAGKLVLRVTIGVLMLFHGVDKVRHGVGGVQRDFAQIGVPAEAAYAVYIAEIVAPVLIIVGVWTRPAAVLYAATILFAALLVHGTEFIRLAPTGGWAAELYVFYTMTAIAVALLGAGRYSVRRSEGPWD